MIRVLLFDWFGVCTKENWVDCLARELTRKLPVEEELVRREFKALLQPFARSEITTDEFLERFVHSLDPNQTPSDFQYLFSIIPEVNAELLRYILTLRKTKKVCLLSNNFGPVFPNYEKQVDFHAYFDELFLSHVLRVSKSQEAIWGLVLSRLNVPAAEVVFIDNKSTYLEYPAKLGVQTVLFKNTDQLRKDLVPYLGPA